MSRAIKREFTYLIMKGTVYYILTLLTLKDKHFTLSVIKQNT